MREFNVEGPCDPQRHYTVMREALVQKGIEKIDKGKYFTIFAPRQSGKTTFFQLMIVQLRGGSYLPLWISFEDLANASKKEFYTTFAVDLSSELAQHGINPTTQIKNNLQLLPLFRELGTEEQNIILIIDEFDGISPPVTSEMMHTFRKMYHKREAHSLHSLILVGVRNISAVVLDQASPFTPLDKESIEYKELFVCYPTGFNISDEIEVPCFTREEIEDLIGQYETESGQKFEKKVVQKIYENTLGQPELVNALCRQLVERFCTDRSKPVDMAGFRQLMDYFLMERIDKNISNIIGKAREQKNFMLKVLFGDSEIPFHIYDERIKFLHSHGVVEKDAAGMVDVSIPLYKNALIADFRPLVNGEGPEYLSPKERFEDFFKDDGLDIDKIIRHYIHYVIRRGFRAFDAENLKESACHYSFDAYIHFFIDRLGGKTFMEAPTGRGRMDTLIVYKDKSYLIEIKRWTDPGYYQKGKRQLAEYLKSEGLREGYYVVFSSRHQEDDTLFEEEAFDGIKIYTYVVRTNFEQPSRI